MKKDVVVLGAGIIGSAIAYHLGRMGLRCIVVDPRGPDASPSATWASAGGLRSQGRSAAEAVLTQTAALRWRTLADELDADLEARFGGHLHVAERDSDLHALEARIDADRTNGIAVERVDQNAVRTLAPHISRSVIAGAFTPGDGQAHPGRTARAFVEAARRLGVALCFGATATPTVQCGRVIGVTLMPSNDRIESETIVLAAGAWSIAILQSLGLDLPIRWRGLQMLVSDVAPPLLVPTVTSVSRNLSLKQSPSGQMMIGGRWWGHSEAAEPVTAPIDGHTARQWSAAAGLLPAMCNLRLAQAWAGVEAQSFDWLPFIGRSRIAGLYLATGFSTHGFQIAPAVGSLAASDIAGETVKELAAFSPERSIAGATAQSLEAFRKEGHLL
jgi:sarcosine oxidase, subunit beta